MKKEELYKIVIKAMKEIDSEDKSVSCDNCFVNKIQKKLSKIDIYYDCYDGSACSNPLFYLQDLGIIKILPGAYDENVGVKCRDLKHTIKIFQGNKIWKKKHFMK